MIAATLALAMATIAIAQTNNQHQQGGTASPGGGMKPAFKPVGPPVGTRPMLQPHSGSQPPFVAIRPPIYGGPRTGVVAPQLGTVAPPQPGFVAAPPVGSTLPEQSTASTQFTWHGRQFQRVHLPPFEYPPSWAYRRWAVGATLPLVLLAPAYFYADWDTLGLDPPPPYCVWLRYGPDLLLANLTTGEIVETIYDVFD